MKFDRIDREQTDVGREKGPFGTSNSRRTVSNDRSSARLYRETPTRPILLLVISLFATFWILLGVKSANARVLYSDNFDGPTLSSVWQPSLPDAPWRFPQETEFANYLGASEYSFEILDGVSVIQLANTLNNAQRVGWSSSLVFTPSSFPSKTRIVYEARLNTLNISSTTGIDELLELWLLDATDESQYDKVELSAPDYGAQRVFNASSSISNFGYDTGLRNPTGFTFNSHTWYRMVLTGSQAEPVCALILDDTDKHVLISVSLRHTLSSFPSGFRIGLSQSMGAPNAPYPTDVAIDYLKVSTERARRRR
jgi:hypothetical protein